MIKNKLFIIIICFLLISSISFILQQNTIYGSNIFFFGISSDNVFDNVFLDKSKNNFQVFRQFKCFFYFNLNYNLLYFNKNCDNYFFQFYNINVNNFFINSSFYLNTVLNNCILKNYILNNYLLKNNNLNFSKNDFNYTENFIKYNQSNDNQTFKESKLRRAEILFFISIPFIYIYVNNLIKLNNYFIYGNFEKEFDNYQKRVLYISFIFFGFDVIFNDLTSRSKDG